MGASTGGLESLDCWQLAIDKCAQTYQCYHTSHPAARNTSHEMYIVKHYLFSVISIVYGR